MTSYSRQQGFTLIEIIIVVTIIGIIVGGVSVFITNDDPARLAKKDIEKFEGKVSKMQREIQELWDGMDYLSNPLK